MRAAWAEAGAPDFDEDDDDVIGLEALWKVAWQTWAVLATAALGLGAAIVWTVRCCWRAGPVTTPRRAKRRGGSGGGGGGSGGAKHRGDGTGKTGSVSKRNKVKGKSDAGRTVA